MPPSRFPPLPLLALDRHPATASGLRSVRASAAFIHRDALRLRYELDGAIEDMLIPGHASPERVEGLWRHTCLELFVMGEDVPAYREFNFSPSGAWQAYAFADYRQGGPLLPASVPGIEREEWAAGAGCFALEVRLPATDLPPGRHLRLGLSVVVETAEGGLSYWALRHPPGRPDFHHSDCFALELIRP